MRRALAAVALALLGGVVGYLVGAGGAPRTSRAERGAAPAPELAPAFRSEPTSDLGRALREMAPPAPPRDDGAITGSVVDSSGNPVAGVLIRAVPRAEAPAPLPPSVRPPDPPDLEHAVRGFVEDFHRRRLGRGDATSGSDGSYAISGLSDVPHGVRAYLDGHVVEPSTGTADSVRPGGTVDFVARPAVAVSVDVLFPDGTRPQEATIRLGKDATRPWTPADPVIAVPPGAYTFSALLPDEESYKSNEVAREVKAGAAVEPVVLRLEGRAGIRGRIRLAPGDRFPFIAVRVLRYSGDRAPTDEELADSDKSHWIGGASGQRYRFYDLEAGRYAVGVDIGEDCIVATKTVEVAGTMVDCDFDVPRIDPRHYVIVRVYAPDGQLVHDVKMEHGASSGGGGSWGTTDFVRRPDGSVLVLHKGGYGHGPDVTYSVTATSAKYGSKQVSYKVADRNEVEIRFGEPATAEVSLQGYDDSRLAGMLEAELLPAAARDQIHDIEGAPGSDGRLTLGPVEAGACDVRVSVKTGKWRKLEIARQTVQLQPGRNAITIALPPLYDLAVLAQPGTELALTRLERGDDDVGSNTAGADGRAVFPRLPAGRYELRGGGARPPEGAMSVILSGSREVAWNPQPCNVIVVLSSRADGPMGALGLQDGDLVVAVDGAAIEGREQARILLAAAAVKDEVSLTVSRGTRTFELKIAGKVIGTAPGNFRPTVR